MRKFLTVGIIVLLAGGAAAYYVARREQPAAAGAQATGAPGQQAAGAPGQGQAGRGGRGARGQAGAQGGGGGFPGGPGGGGGFRPPMTVEVTKVARGRVSSSLTVVGNLIGAQTVDVVPRTGGRLISVNVKLGDIVRKGQTLAKIEDREFVQQVRQAEASHQVAQATIRQREADLNLALTNAERSRNLYQRQLLPKQTLDDSEARYSSAVAALDLANAQLAQSEARMQELRINLQNTIVQSPVNGFVSKRNLDVGGFASQNQPVLSVVDISSLRLVANVVEKDLRAVNVGDRAIVEVDAYPGDKFPGRIARLSPVLDPATRTAPMEVEVVNRDARLKPGMYARVDLVVEDKDNALVVPKIAIVDSEGQRGVYQPGADNKAKFKAVKLGIENNETAEILEGLSEGDIVVSNGAGALRREDQLVVAGAGGSGGGRGGRGGRRGQGQGAPGQPPAPGAGANPPATAAPPAGSGQAPSADAAEGVRPQRQPGVPGQGREGFQPGQRREGSQPGQGRDGQTPRGGRGRPEGARRPSQSQSVQQQRPIA